MSKIILQRADRFDPKPELWWEASETLAPDGRIVAARRQCLRGFNFGEALDSFRRLRGGIWVREGRWRKWYPAGPREMSLLHIYLLSEAGSITGHEDYRPAHVKAEERLRLDGAGEDYDWRTCDGA